ncbi:MAG: hypothetical protein HZC55_28770 [Verrucomicrobia bacterium]|nr:hypothetical protein [Verrucomicrobiota bacterium]
MLHSLISLLRKPLILAAGLAAATSAFAVPVTIDFTSGTGNNTTTYDEDGFRVRAQSGDHFENNYQGDGYFSWHDGSANNPPNILTLDRADGSGGLFTALSVTLVHLSSNPSGPGGVIFRDSNGHSVTATTLGPVTLNFANTAYVQFQIVNSGNNNFPISIDNFNLDTNPNALPGVPDSASTLFLCVAGLAGLAVGARRNRR